jgi:hypothetical protein
MLRFDPKGFAGVTTVKVYKFVLEPEGCNAEKEKLLIEEYGSGKVLYEETRYEFEWSKNNSDIHRTATLLTLLGLEVYTLSNMTSVSAGVSVEHWELFVPEQIEPLPERIEEPGCSDPRLMQWQTLTNAALANYQNGICTADETRISVSNSTFAPCTSWHKGGFKQ